MTYFRAIERMFSQHKLHLKELTFQLMPIPNISNHAVCSEAHILRPYGQGQSSPRDIVQPFTSHILICCFYFAFFRYQWSIEWRGMPYGYMDLCVSTVDSRYVAVQYNTIFHPAQKCWRENFSQTSNSPKIPIARPIGRAIVSFVSYLEKSDREISGAHCIWF